MAKKYSDRTLDELMATFEKAVYDIAYDNESERTYHIKQMDRVVEELKTRITSITKARTTGKSFARRKMIDPKG